MNVSLIVGVVAGVGGTILIALIVLIVVVARRGNGCKVSPAATDVHVHVAPRGHDKGA